MIFKLSAYYLIGVLLLTLNSEASQKKLSQSQLTPNEASQKIVKQLKLSIDVVAKSTTACELDENPKAPLNTFNILKAYYPNTTLCQALNQLTPEELLYFREALEVGSKDGTNTECLVSVLTKIVNHTNFRLEQLRFSNFLKNSNSITFDLNVNRDIIGPSTEIEIDTTGGDRYIFAELPHKHIALTFDDGPHGHNTEKLLKILKNHKIKVTFFTVGRNVNKYPHITKNISADGHSLGNHTWSHPNLRKLSSSRGEVEINKGFKELIDLVPNVSPFFRYPYGNHTSHLRRYLQNENIGEFFWSIDTLDWKIKDPLKLHNYALKQIESTKKGIVLFHDVQTQTIQMMPQLLKSLAQKGYTVVLLKPKAYL